MLPQRPSTLLPAIARCTLLLVASLGGTATLHGQDPAKLAYDVSTVRLHNPAGTGGSWSEQNGELSVMGAPLRFLIADAWGVRPDQVVGEPAWADDQHWDLTAKVTDTPAAVLKQLTVHDLQRMLQTLLIERFQARVHVETRTVKVFDLVPAKSGIRLKALPPLTDSKPADGTMPRGSLMLQSTAGGANEMIASGISMQALIDNIALNLQQTIIDKTGLPADVVYDIKLRFTPETGAGTIGNADAPSIRDALQEQLGLHLEPARGPVRTIVVDSVEKPRAN